MYMFMQMDKTTKPISKIMYREFVSAAFAGAECNRCVIRSGRNHAALAAGYLPPEITVAECAAESGFAVSGGADPMIEDPWEDL